MCSLLLLAEHMQFMGAFRIVDPGCELLLTSQPALHFRYFLDWSHVSVPYFCHTCSCAPTLKVVQRDLWGSFKM